MKRTKKLIATMLVFISFASLNAIFDDYEPSPRARALGGAFSPMSNDANAIFYNPAGLNSIDSKSEIRTGYFKGFGLDFFENKAVAISTRLPKNWGTVGLGLQMMDVDFKDKTLQSEKIYSLAYAFTPMKDVHSRLYVGFSANIYHLDIHGFGDQAKFGLNLGALAILHERTRLGFSVSNITNSKVGKNSEHPIPQKLSVGVAYIPFDNITTSLVMKKTFNGASESDDNPTQVHAGCETKILEVLALRVGIRNKPTSFSFGFGLDIKNILVDYAFNSHAVLEDTHHFGIGYKF